MKKAVSLLTIVLFVVVAPLAEASHEHAVPTNGNGGPGLFSLGLGAIAGIATAVLTGSKAAGAAAGVAGLVVGRGIEGYAASSAAAKGITHCDTHVRKSMGRQVIHDEDCISTVTRPGYMGTVGHAPTPPIVTYEPHAVIVNPYPDAKVPQPTVTTPPAPEAKPAPPSQEGMSQPWTSVPPQPQAERPIAQQAAFVTNTDSAGSCDHLDGEAFQQCIRPITERIIGSIRRM